jgi:hypothetical protein
MSNIRIQLQDGYLDVKDNKPFPLNFAVSDIRDVTKKGGTFSRTITLANTRNNHNLLNHYYDVNVSAGTFDVNRLTPCVIWQDGEVIVDNAYIQLLNVVKRQTTISLDQQIEYEVAIIDSKSDFFTKITNLELTDLDFTDLNHTYTAVDIFTTFSNTQADNYKYLLGYTDSKDTYLKDYKPAIYAKTYFDRIFAQAGYSYVWDELEDNNFDKFIIPYNGELSSINYDDYNIRSNSVNGVSDGFSDGFQTAWSEPLTSWDDEYDPQSIWDMSTGEYQFPFNVNAGDKVTFKFVIDYSYMQDNTHTSTAYLKDTSGYGFSGPAYYIRPKFYVTKNSTSNVIYTTPLNGEKLYYNNDTLASGTTTIIDGQQVVEVEVSGCQAGDILQFRLGADMPRLYTGQKSYWKKTNSSTGIDAIVNVAVDYDIQMSVTTSQTILVVGGEVAMNDYIPKKIKQKDFVKSILTMYNLYVDNDGTDSNVLRLVQRDKYYDDGTEVDWTAKLAKDKDQKLRFLPELTNKKILFTYKEDKDQANVGYKDATNEVYGQLEFTFDNEYIKDVDTKEIIFSPTPTIINPWGCYIPAISFIAPNTNIRILYDGGEQPCETYKIIESVTINSNQSITYDYYEEVSSYPMVTHFDNPSDPHFDLNFGVCDRYFYNSQLTNNNLYNLYWRRTIEQINSGKMLTAYFRLNAVDIAKLKLSDKIRINNSWWNINKVIDYDANKPDLTQVELLSVDEALKFTPFKTRRFVKREDDFLIGESLRDVRESQASVVSRMANVSVYGQGNQIGSNASGIVVGSGWSVDEAGVFTPTLQTRTINGIDADQAFENFANADLLFTGDRNHNLDNNELHLDRGNVYINKDFKPSADKPSLYVGSSNEAAIELESTDGLALKVTDGGIALKVIYTDVDYDMTLNDHGVVVIKSTLVTPSITITLPYYDSGFNEKFFIKNFAYGTAVTITTPDGRYIDDALTKTALYLDSITIIASNTLNRWIII